MPQKLLIVESPKKAKTIQKFLTKDWIVRASYGHIRQLAQDGEDKLGFDLKGDRVYCRYKPVSPRAAKNIKQLKQLAQSASLVVLATDQDREGEGISYHLKEALGLRKFERITYNEVTEAAIKKAIASPRQLDENLVGAALARACLDKLVGYKVSPILWSLNIGAKSTGRVQAPTLHIVCQRERQIQKFKPEPYWTVWVDYQEGFRAYFLGTESNKVNEGSDSNERDDTEARDGQKVETCRVSTEARARELVNIARSQPHQVIKVETFLTYKKPPAPFTTSSLQQAAGARIKYSPEKTMQIAQHLFESGLITYHRTDSTNLSEDFVKAARKYLQEKDPANLPSTAPKFRSKKNAQEAHEAIRPTDLTKPSTVLKQELDQDNFALYELIWRRAMASQCNPAQIDKTRITSKSGDVFWLARGQVLKFAGYSRYWKDFGGDSELPKVKEGANLTLKQADSERKMTQPPPRYSEAKLVQVMERQGIGRPSTYSSTVKTLKERAYVKIVKGKLTATELGLSVDQFQSATFPKLIDSQFTAEMEKQLDEIAQGRQDWQKYLTGWNRDYFANAVNSAKSKAGVEAKSVQKPNYATGTREKSRQKCPKCGKQMDKIPSKSKKLSRPYFLKCTPCDVVMFYNKEQKTWDKPSQKREQTIPKITEYICPVCNSFLAEKTYQKNGQTKKMLVCSTQQHKDKDVVYFQSQEKWWSPVFGEL
ncbi:MAG: type I DNA topoisomerase [Xenococcaceae cyanobacterium MO_234.B1]|nr:type I DNA topoisomerase [Xenococcaceae cyanobacterium MO_234.B1]